MKKYAFLKRALIGMLVVIMVPFGALSQQTSAPAPAFTEAELDQMLAPIAQQYVICPEIRAECGWAAQPAGRSG